MARFKRFRRRASRGIARMKRYSRRSGSSGGIKGLLGSAMNGAIYGAVRQPIDNYVGSKLKPMLGFAGDYVDEAAAIITLIAAKKFIRNPMVNRIADTGLAIEGARIGAKLTAGLGLGSQAIANNSSSVKVYS